MSDGEGSTAFTVVQNELAQLELLLARRKIQRESSLLLSCQILGVVLLPVGIALWSFIYPDLKPVGSILALLMGALDIFVLDRKQKGRLIKSAKLQEQFDCNVFQLPWNEYVAGEPLTHEFVDRKQGDYIRKKPIESVLSWYPEIFGTLPLWLGRLAAQQVNMNYDQKVRKSYRLLLVGVVAFIAVMFILSASLGQMTMPALLLGVFVPVAPIINWCAREVFRQHDALTKLRATSNLAKNAWIEAITGKISPETASTVSREIQNSSFARRSASPAVFERLYWWRRKALERQMLVEAGELTVKARNSVSQGA